jgi:hypothetical protein
VRPSWFIAMGLALAVLASAGCSFSDTAKEPLRLRPMVPGAVGKDNPVFQVRMVRLMHRQRADAPAEDLWRLLGSTNVPYEKHALWEANDLRLGDGAQLAADRMNELATDTPDRTTQTSILQVRENMDFVVTLGPERPALDVIWTDSSGHLMGRHFDRVQVQFRLVCRSDPADPEAVRIALVPEFLSGPEELHWVPSEGGNYTQRIVPATFVLSDYAAEVRLPAARLLVIGGQGKSGLSLGSVLFQEHRGPDVWNQTIIVTVQRAKPGEIPESGNVPLMQPSGKAARPTVKVVPKPAPEGAPGAPKPADKSSADPATPQPPAAPIPGLPELPRR